jgi:hypothetical protein
MRCLDHAHVVRTVTDCQENALLVLLDKFDDESFLKWRYPATDDCATHERELQKGLGELFLQCETQAFAVYDQSQIFELSRTPLILDR